MIGNIGLPSNKAAGYNKPSGNRGTLQSPGQLITCNFNVPLGNILSGDLLQKKKPRQYYGTLYLRGMAGEFRLLWHILLSCDILVIL